MFFFYSHSPGLVLTQVKLSVFSLKIKIYSGKSDNIVSTVYLKNIYTMYNSGAA